MQYMLPLSLVLMDGEGLQLRQIGFGNLLVCSVLAICNEASPYAAACAETGELLTRLSAVPCRAYLHELSHSCFLWQLQASWLACRRPCHQRPHRSQLQNQRIHLLAEVQERYLRVSNTSQRFQPFWLAVSLPRASSIFSSRSSCPIAHVQLAPRRGTS